MTKSLLAQQLWQVREQGKKAIVPYLMAGDPDLAATRMLVEELARSGVTAIELGVPFSDPVADGPVIQAAGLRSLKNETNLTQILQLVADCKKRLQTPLILMSYYNPIYSFGEERFWQEAKAAGVDGVIIPDLPFGESAAVRQAAGGSGVQLIPLIAPNTGPGVLRAMAQESNGFVYCISVKGVTGERFELPREVADLLKQVKQIIVDPVYLGFGISRPEQVASLKSAADGFIIGSALVKIMQENSGSSRQLRRAVTEFISGFLAAAE